MVSPIDRIFAEQEAETDYTVAKNVAEKKADAFRFDGFNFDVDGFKIDLDGFDIISLALGAYSPSSMLAEGITQIPVLGDILNTLIKGQNVIADKLDPLGWMKKGFSLLNEEDDPLNKIEKLLSDFEKSKLKAMEKQQ